jgi:hypothetical protein
VLTNNARGVIDRHGNKRRLPDSRWAEHVGRESAAEHVGLELQAGIDQPQDSQGDLQASPGHRTQLRSELAENSGVA